MHAEIWTCLYTKGSALYSTFIDSNLQKWDSGIGIFNKALMVILMLTHCCKPQFYLISHCSSIFSSQEMQIWCKLIREHENIETVCLERKGRIRNFVSEPSSGGVHLFFFFKKSPKQTAKTNIWCILHETTDALSVKADITFPQINISKFLKNSCLKRHTLICGSYYKQVSQSGFFNQ